MTASSDSTSSGTGGFRSVSSNEVRWMLLQATERSRELDAERAALSELEGTLEVDRGGVRWELQALDAECDELSASIEAAKERIIEVESEVEATTREANDLSYRTDLVRRQLERTLCEVQGLERGLVECNREISRAEHSFQSMVGRVLRLDYKMRRTGRDGE